MARIAAKTGSNGCELQRLAADSRRKRGSEKQFLIRVSLRKSAALITAGAGLDLFFLSGVASGASGFAARF